MTIANPYVDPRPAAELRTADKKQEIVPLVVRNPYVDSSVSERDIGVVRIVNSAK